MPANSITAFDAMAQEYDGVFSHSLIGNSQRMQTRKWLSGFLKGRDNLNILEINCGTGDDALWLASLGHRVLATDASAAMIQQAKNKLSAYNDNGNVEFRQFDFTELHSMNHPGQFDLVFSNFSGLNCVPANKIRLLNNMLLKLLNPGGHLAFVTFGKYCIWETIYHLGKLNTKNAFRRWNSKPSSYTKGDSSTQSVYYFTIKDFKDFLLGFRCIEKKPVGLFIPPSYLEESIKKRKGFFRFLQTAEQKMGGLSFCSSLSDHCYLLFERR